MISNNYYPLAPPYVAHVVLFCRCGWQMELFNGDIGACKNRRCEEYGRVVTATVKINQIEPRTEMLS